MADVGALGTALGERHAASGESPVEPEAARARLDAIEGASEP